MSQSRSTGPTRSCARKGKSRSWTADTAARSEPSKPWVHYAWGSMFYELGDTDKFLMGALRMGLDESEFKPLVDGLPLDADGYECAFYMKD